MIAITFALPAESRDLVKKLRDQNVTVFHTGVGRKNCQDNIDTLLRTQRPRILISSGFAGATQDDLKVGDLIVAENFSEGDLQTRAEKCGARAIKLFTAATIVDSSEERNRIADSSGADAVDMETEVIAKACATHGVPMLSLRVISDTPSQPFPAPPSVLFDIDRQRTDALKLASYLLAHPTATLRLLRFSRQIKSARRKLTHAILDLLQTLA